MVMIFTNDFSGGVEGVSAPQITEDLGYSYPEGLDLSPDSETHRKLVGELTRRAQASHSTMSQKHPVWDEIDRIDSAYIYTDKKELEQKAKDPRKPMPLVVPYSRALRETLLTHWMGTFWTRPMFPYDGVGPEDTVGAMLLEQVIDLQMQHSAAGLTIHQCGRDVLTYGIGAMTPVWERIPGFRTVMQPKTALIGNQFVQVGEERVRIPVIKFEGNRLDAIDPRALFPDPNAPLGEPQRGEYVGWLRREQFHDLLGRERDPQSGLFNVKYLKGGDFRSPIYMGMGLQANISNTLGTRMPPWSGGIPPVDVLYMFVKLIPKDWELGGSEDPETWMFGLAGDRILISAQPLDLDHNMFPIGIACPDYDGRSMLPVSQLEVVHGLQEVVDFMVNSHVAEVRESLNNTWLIDPMAVNQYDFERRGDKEGGRIIRLNMSHWGRGVKGYLEQFPVQDVTSNHIPQTADLYSMMQSGTGANDIAMGVMNKKSGDRTTGEEIQEHKMATLSRLALRSTVAGLQMFQPIGFMLASQTQQFLSEDGYVKSVGRYAQDLQAIYGVDASGRIPFSLRDLLVDYDCVFRDSSQGIGQNVQEWLQMMQMTSSDPTLIGKWDSTRMLLEAMRRMGEKNGLDFMAKIPPVQMQVLPDAQVMQQVQAGNLAPMGGPADVAAVA